MNAPEQTNPASAQLGKLMYLCRGDGEAVRFILSTWGLVEVYDDAVDGERVAPDEAHAAIHWALFGMRENAFYKKNALALDAAMATAIAEWRTANEMERAKKHLETAYVLRCSPFTLFTLVVALCSGQEMAQEAAMYFRTLDYVDDSLQSYLDEHLKG